MEHGDATKARSPQAGTLGTNRATPPTSGDGTVHFIFSSIEKAADEKDSLSTPGDASSALGYSSDENMGETSALPFSRARCIALVATVTGAAFLNTLSLQAVVIILPTIGEDLDIPESRQQWVVSSYALTFGCFLLLWGRLADCFGKRLIFILGSIWVTVVTIANAFVPNEIAFDLFRGLHGLGAAANVPTAIGILGVTFPPGKAKNYAFSAYASGAPLGSICGNILSGCIAEYADWKWVFGALAILAGIISVAGIFFIPPPPPRAVASTKPTIASVDWIGATLITTGLIALMFALTQGNVVGWSTPWIPVLIVISVIIIGLFAAWQHYLETKTTRPPLVKVSIFRNLRFSAVMVIMGLFFASFNNYLIYATYYLQDYQGHSPLQTMLRFIPTGVTGALVAFIVAQLLGRVPTLFLLVTGHVAVSLASLLFAVPIPPSTSYFAWAMIAMILSVVGADTSWPVLTLFVSAKLPQEDQAIGGALINAVGQFGRAIGLAISTAIQTAVMASERGVDVKNAGGMIMGDDATLKGIRAASWLDFGYSMASLVLVLIAFRSMEIVGKAKPLPVRSSGGEVSSEQGRAERGEGDEEPTAVQESAEDEKRS